MAEDNNFVKENKETLTGDSFALASMLQQAEKYRNEKEEELNINRLAVYFGEDYWVNDTFCICQPTLWDFIKKDEKNIYSSITPFTNNSTSMLVQLWDMGIDWTKVSDIEMFAFLCKTVNMEYTSLIFKRIMNPNEIEEYRIKNNLSIEQIQGIDFKDREYLKPLELNTFELFTKKNPDDEENDIITTFSKVCNLEIDEETYKQIAHYVQFMFNAYPPKPRKMKGKKNKEMWVTKTRVENAKKEKESANSSSMLAMISFALNHPGFKYKKNELKEVGIIEFMDSIQRLQIYESTRSLLSGSMSGFCDTSKIDKNEFNFMRDVSISK